MDDLEIPEFMKISTEARAEAWRKNPPKAMPLYDQTRQQSPEAIEMERKRREIEKAQSYERIRKLKAKQEGPIDYTDMVYNPRNLRWEVPKPLPTKLEDTAGYRTRMGYKPNDTPGNRPKDGGEIVRKDNSGHAGVHRVEKADRPAKKSGRNTAKRGGRLARRK